MKLSLRDYQKDAVLNLRDAYVSGAKRPLFALPTGAGKTFVFSWIAQQAVVRSGEVLILVHRRRLVMQSSAALDGLGVEHGLIAPGHTQTDDDVQVASVQTLVRRLKKIKINPSLIIIDEAHHAVAGSWRKIIEAFPNARLLGVTATPCRLDGKGLGVEAGGLFDAMVKGPTMSWLIDNEFLAPYRVFAPPVQFSTKKVPKRGGDWVAGELAKRVDKPTITGDAVEHYKRICNGLPGIAFCCNVVHTKNVAAEFNARGVPAAVLTGEMSAAEQEAAMMDLETRKISVLVTCEIVSEGFDLPMVVVVIMLRSTESLTLYLQQAGRALRWLKGKVAIILDHVGNTEKHGMPCEDREWTLDGVLKRKQGDGEETGPKFRQCEKCFFCFPLIPTCPNCGHEVNMMDNTPDFVEGELVELTAGELAAKRRKRSREEGDCRSLDDLKALAKERGYKSGWAFHRWTARQNRMKRSK